MVAEGRWRATATAPGHAGFRLNALVSPLPKATWGKLAGEFLVAKNDTDDLEVFTNTIIGQGWLLGKGGAITARISTKPSFRSGSNKSTFDALPEEVLSLTAGVDVQDDRLEVSIVGWTRPWTPADIGQTRFTASVSRGRITRLGARPDDPFRCRSMYLI